MKRKVIGTSLAAAGLLAASFLAGGLMFNGGGSAAPSTNSGPMTGIVTPTVTPKILTPTVTASATPTVTVTPFPPASGGNGAGSVGGSASGGSISPSDGGSQVGNPGTSNVVTVTPEPGAPQPPAPQPEPPAPQPPVEEPEVEEPATPVEEPQPEEVNEVPSVVNTTPADGVNKQQPGVDITVTFSEAMDQASAEAAFSVNPAVAGTFSWDAEGKVMTFAPNASFAHGTHVNWQVAGAAKDATGLAMGEDFNAGFWILMQKTITLYSQPDRDGYAGYAGTPPMGPFPMAIANGNKLLVGWQTRGFLTFDLSELPAGTQQIVAAELVIHQIDHSPQAYGAATGDLRITSVAYETLDFADYHAPAVEFCLGACAPVSYLLSDNAADGWKTADVTKFVQRDWENSKGDPGAGLVLPGGLERLTQFRLQFDKENINVPGISAEFHAGEAGNSAPKLQVTIIY
jgi:hypothetical protein